MKKIFSIFVLILMLVLGGCTVADDNEKTLMTYVVKDQATEEEHTFRVTTNEEHIEILAKLKLIMSLDFDVILGRNVFRDRNPSEPTSSYYISKEFNFTVHTFKQQQKGTGTYITEDYRIYFNAGYNTEINLRVTETKTTRTVDVIKEIKYKETWLSKADEETTVKETKPEYVLVILDTSYPITLFEWHVSYEVQLMTVEEAKKDNRIVYTFSEKKK